MGTKTISIMNDVYKLLLARKRKGESFSDVIRNTLRRKRSIMEFAGCWNTVSEKDVKEMKGAIKELRRRSMIELLERAG